jgi:ABC-2 type transport system ATP-binding protein
VEGYVATLKLDNVYKSYGDVQAVNDLSLVVNEGQIFGLLGPNGAGKSTTIRMIMDIIKPDAGTIEILGEKSSNLVRNRIGYLPEERGLYPKMLVSEVIQFFAEIKGLPKKEVPDRAYDWLEKFELEEWKDKKVEELSRGMQQKLQFICTVIHDPKLIILDEPFTGLDPSNTVRMIDIIRNLQQNGASIIFSTHMMERVEKLCESICLIDHGSAVLKGPLAHIKSQFGQNRILMRFEGEGAFLQNKSLVAEYGEKDRFVELHPARDVEPQVVLAAAMEQVNVQHFEIEEPSLEEIFIQVVERG